MHQSPTEISRPLRVALCASAFLWLSCICFSLNWSSIAMWDRYLPPREGSTQVLWGKPRPIRSDEWLVNSTFMLAAASQENSAGVQDLAGPPGSELLMSLPVPHFSTLFRPQFWGFRLLGPDVGFSWYWVSKVVGLVLVSFVTLLLLTRRSFIAAGGTVWLTLSSFTQWWFSTSLPEMFTYGLAAAVAAFGILRSEKPWLTAVAFAGFIGASVNYLLFIYPPFTIPIMHACVAVGVALAIRYGLPKRVALLKRTGLLFVGFAAVGAVMFAVYVEIAPVIEIVQNTVYPGRRVAEAGGFPLNSYLVGLGDLFFTDERYPPALGNVCEAASFILLWPLIFILLALRLVEREVACREVLMLLPLVMVLLLHASWMTLWIPDGLAKILGLQMVPDKRTLAGMGLASIVAMSVASGLPWTARKGPVMVVGTLALSVIIGVCLATSLSSAVEGFFSRSELIYLGATLSAASFGFLVGAPRVFWVAICALVIPNVTVNPLGQGAAPVSHRKLIEAAREIRATDPSARWAVFGEGIFANLLKVSGVRVFNGVSYAPRLSDYRKLDPSGGFAPVYNRYAHIQMVTGAVGAPVSFSLASADAFVIAAHPCDPALADIGVRYFVFTYQPQESEIACLKPIRGKDFGARFRVYKRPIPSKQL